MSFKIENGVLLEWTPQEGETTVNVPDGVTEIGTGALRLRKSAVHVVLPDSVEKIGGMAFMECENLESITFGKGLKSIGSMAFHRCFKLKSVTFPDGVTIGDNAFWDCRGLEKIEFQGGAAEIQEHAFWECTSMKRIPVIALDGKVFWDNDRYGDVRYEDIQDMVVNHNYSVQMKHEVKFDLLVQIYHAGTDAEGVNAYIKKNFKKVFTYLAERDDRETLSQLLEEGNYITKRTFDKYLETARDMGQSGIVGLLDAYQKEHLV